jgi:hypothetical protein
MSKSQLPPSTKAKKAASRVAIDLALSTAARPTGRLLTNPQDMGDVIVRNVITPRDVAEGKATITSASTSPSTIASRVTYGATKAAMALAGVVLGPIVGDFSLSVGAVGSLTSGGYDQTRIAEQAIADVIQDNSHTTQQVGVAYDKFDKTLNELTLKYILDSNPKFVGRTSLTDAEFEEEKKKFFAMLDNNSDMRESYQRYLLSNVTEWGNYKEMRSTAIATFGPLHNEYFGPSDKDAKLYGFTGPGGVKKGVVLQVNKANNMLVIRNMEIPPEKLNCTLRIPRVDESGRKLKSFDTVVIRNGKPVMILQGKQGKSRIANLADMMAGIAKDHGSEMAASRSGDRNTGMTAKRSNVGSGMEATKVATRLAEADASSVAISSGTRRKSPRSSGVERS